MKTKKLISPLLAILLASICSVTAFATTNTSYNRNIDETSNIQPRYTGIYDFDVSYSKVNNKFIGTASGCVKSSYTGKIIIYIQRSSNGSSWTTVKTEQVDLRGGLTKSIDASTDLLSNYYYRAKAYIYAYSNDGSLVESDVLTTITVKK